MEEKYGAIWISVEEDGAAKIAFESYLADKEKLHLIFIQNNGSYVPYSFIKQVDHQWRLPIWCKENEKALMPTLEMAKEYLTYYQ